MTTFDNASTLLSEADHRAQLRRAVIASTVGTTIEWYDFLLYSIVTGLAFGKLFFPKSDPLVGVLEAFATSVGVARHQLVDGPGPRSSDRGRACAVFGRLGCACVVVAAIPADEHHGA